MNTLPASSARLRVRAKHIAKVVTALMLALPLTAFAQENPKDRQEATQVFRLAHVTQMNDLSETLQAVRNVLGARFKAYPNSTQSAIICRGTPDELEEARKLITELDKPVPLYRLTFTITQLEGDKQTGSQLYVFMAAEGQKVEFKDGHRVPVMTGTIGQNDSAPQSTISYVDVGLSISATFQGSSLKAKVEESAVADEKSTVNIQDPIIRQVWLANETTIIPGKTVVLGSFDIPNSTMHRDVQVRVERVP
jgi:type II secretory pathway component GspD/PulD (secretin)